MTRESVDVRVSSSGSDGTHATAKAMATGRSHFQFLRTKPTARPCTCLASPAHASRLRRFLPRTCSSFSRCASPAAQSLLDRIGASTVSPPNLAVEFSASLLPTGSKRERVDMPEGLLHGRGKDQVSREDRMGRAWRGEVSRDECGCLAVPSAGSRACRTQVSVRGEPCTLVVLIVVVAVLGKAALLGVSEEAGLAPMRGVDGLLEGVEVCRRVAGVR